MNKSLEDQEARKGGDNEVMGSRQAQRAKRAYMKPARKSKRAEKK